MIYLIMTAMCLTASTGQILVKKGINRKKPNYLDIYIFAGGFLVVLSPLLYLKAVSMVGLSGAFGLNGLSYIIVYILGVAILREKGSFLQTLGILLISGGVFIWSM